MIQYQQASLLYVYGMNSLQFHKVAMPFSIVLFVNSYGMGPINIETRISPSCCFLRPRGFQLSLSRILSRGL